MQKSQCIQLLRTTFLKAPQQKNNLSKLTQQAWGENKKECLQLVGDFSHIRSLLGKMQQSGEEHESPVRSNTTLCQEKLISTFRKDFSQKKNLSKLSNEAW